MAAKDNMFYVEPANPLQALMSGVQGYDRADQMRRQNDLEAGRKEAVATLASGEDIRGPLAKLIGIGDVQGARAVADYANSTATQAHQAAILKETAAHNRATEAIAREGLEKPVALPAGSELYTRKGEKIAGDNT